MREAARVLDVLRSLESWMLGNEPVRFGRGSSGPVHRTPPDDLPRWSATTRTAGTSNPPKAHHRRGARTPTTATRGRPPPTHATASTPPPAEGTPAPTP